MNKINDLYYLQIFGHDRNHTKRFPVFFFNFLSLLMLIAKIKNKICLEKP